MEERIRIIVNADTEFSQIAVTNQRSAIKGGFAAETVHKESFNLDAISKKKTVRAYNDNDFEFFQQGFKKNDPSVDIVTVKGDEISQKSQVKYYQDGKTTANALREQRPDGSAKYHETDQHIVPGDQVNDVQDAARRTSQKELQNRPKVAAAADEVERKSTGRLPGRWGRVSEYQ